MPSLLKRNIRELKTIKNEEIITIFLLSISRRYIIENMKKMLKNTKASIKSVITLPSLHRKRLLSIYQNSTAKIRQKNEKQADFMIFVLPVMIKIFLYYLYNFIIFLLFFILFF